MLKGDCRHFVMWSVPVVCGPWQPMWSPTRPGAGLRLSAAGGCLGGRGREVGHHGQFAGTHSPAVEQVNQKAFKVSTVLTGFDLCIPTIVAWPEVGRRQRPECSVCSHLEAG